MTLALAPHSGAHLDAQGRMVAASRDVWLRFEEPGALTRAGFVELTYRAGAFDDPVRPVLRFLTPGGVIERILPGPVAGAAIWRGAAPRDATQILISPCAREGRFDFCVESARPMLFREMLTRVRRRRPAKLWSVLLPTLFGFHAEAENAIDWAIGGEPIERFEEWLALRRRDVDASGFDAPRCDWSRGPRFDVIVSGEGEKRSRTLASLERQLYPQWRLVGSSAERGGDFLLALKAGDALEPQALAVVAEEVARRPGAKLFYADEMTGEEGRRAPLFKPDWSPLLESARPYLGRCVFLRRDDFAAGEERDPARAAGKLDGGEIVHIRRLLMRAQGEAPVSGEAQRAAPSPAQAPEPDAAAPARPRGGTEIAASVVVLTRDRADFLGPCVDSVLERSTHPDFELIIVDNGTTQKAALEILRRVSNDRRVTVVERPIPFNYSHFNNDAARLARGRVLVFLNNDTEILSPDWLERLCAQAVAPEVGAVGALLLFPNGRVQHAGVTVGLGQDAGHFEALAAPSAPSWLERNGVAHEIAAVTGACLAVERRKFDAVEGFDGERLPIEFNDIDFCLRLAEKGWRNRYDPAVILTHKESATRGNALLRPLSVYARERDYFRNRWRDVIRDDPYFHPGLSLYARRSALS